MRTSTRSAFAALLAISGVIAAWLIGQVGSYSVISLVSSVAIIGLAATSLSIVWGQVGQISLAQTAIFGVGAYATMIFIGDLGMPLVTALLLSMVITAVLGAVISLPLLRMSGHYFAILTFAIAMVIETFEIRLHTITGGFGGLVMPAEASSGQFWSTPAGTLTLSASVVAALLLALHFVISSPLGDRFHATRENPVLAQAIGIAIRRQRVYAFAIAGAVAGAAGALYSVQTKAIAPDLFGTMIAIAFIAIVLVGGVNLLFGGLVGAAIYYAVPYYLGLEPLHNQILFGLILLFLVVRAPNGLMPWVIELVRSLMRRSRRAQQDDGGAAVPRADKAGTK